MSSNLHIIITYICIAYAYINTHKSVHMTCTCTHVRTHHTHAHLHNIHMHTRATHVRTHVRTFARTLARTHANNKHSLTHSRIHSYHRKKEHRAQSTEHRAQSTHGVNGWPESKDTVSAALRPVIVLLHRRRPPNNGRRFELSLNCLVANGVCPRQRAAPRRAARSGLDQSTCSITCSVRSVVGGATQRHFSSDYDADSNVPTPPPGLGLVTPRSVGTRRRFCRPLQ